MFPQNYFLSLPIAIRQKMCAWSRLSSSCGDFDIVVNL